ncbi:MAG: ribosomal-processing cysteine protease Prp [Eubacteriales bacterium]|jgi:uncharacterized protein YsxB (DUF464 family)|nr:ribosomal-processing cysteine protease Prp [Eubacteriales bacterium]
MTKITFFKRDGVFYGFKEEGHTDYGSMGDDILCSALSAMTMLIINAIEISFATKVDYDIDEESTIITVKVYGALPEYEENPMKRYAVSGLIQAYYYQLNDMLEEYYDFMYVDEINE